MEANELRLNNYTSCNFGIVQISAIRDIECEVHNADFNVNTCVFTNKLEPIPLTEEILLKCGSTELIKGFHYHDRFNLKWMEAYKYWYVTDIVTGAYITKVEFVHEWQNTWFVLQGQELSVQL